MSICVVSNYWNFLCLVFELVDLLAAGFVLLGLDL